MSHISKGIVVGALTAFVITSLGLAPASAHEDRHARDVAHLIDHVRPNKVVNDAIRPDGVPRANKSGDTVKVPARSNGVLMVKGGSGVDIAVVLPGDGSAATVAPDGTVVYGDEAGATVAVQGESGAARVHTVMQTRDDVEDVRYVLPNLTPELNADGSVTLFATSADGSVQASVGYIDVPWAADANGNALDTNYRVEGNAVIQEVAVDGDTAFPVVSDPFVQGDCGIITCTVRWDRAWTKKMRDFGGDAGLVAGAFVTAAGALGGPYGVALGLAGGASVAAKASIMSTRAGDFYKNGNCFGIKYPKKGNPAMGWATQVNYGTYNCQ